MFTCLFVYWSAGTGKTLILCEALKIKLSKLLRQGRRVRMLATGFYSSFTTELLNSLKTRYLVSMKDIKVMSLEELCRDFNIKYNNDTPRDTINRVIISMSEIYPEDITLLLVDEVWPCCDGQPTPDWRELEVRENVIWLLGLSPRAVGAASTEVLPPVNSSVLSRPLIYKHRNCPQIRNFIKTITIKIKLFEILI